MNIEINLVSDWSVYLTKRLDAIGGQLWRHHPTPADVGKAFFNAALRRIPARPRRSRMPNPPFQIPIDERFAKGYRQILVTSEAGGDLLPFQSTGLLTHDGKDALLFDWGIYHLHLRADPHPKKAGFNARSDPLLFVFVDDTDFYQIAINSHGEWSCIELLNIVEKNWPYLLKNAITNVANINAISKDEDVDLMRDAQINYAVRLSSGNTYSLIGHGVALSGEAMDANFAMIRSHSILDAIERRFRGTTQQLRHKLERRGYDVPNTAVVRLIVDAHSVKIVEQTSGLILHEFSMQEQAALFGGSISSMARHL